MLYTAQGKHKNDALLISIWYMSSVDFSCISTYLKLLTIYTGILNDALEFDDRNLVC